MISAVSFVMDGAKNDAGELRLNWMTPPHSGWYYRFWSDIPLCRSTKPAVHIFTSAFLFFDKNWSNNLIQGHGLHLHFIYISKNSTGLSFFPFPMVAGNSVVHEWNESVRHRSSSVRGSTFLSFPIVNDNLSIQRTGCDSNSDDIATSQQ